ncbi:MAG: efflux RND transporter periplasmic adaptor subunit [Bdellovibrionia bacterium]
MKIRIALFAILTLAQAAFADPRTVFVQNMKTKELFDVLNFPGRVESTVNAQIYSESDGVVTKLLRPVGEQVNRGEKILVVKHTDPIYSYAPVALTSPVSGVVSQVKVTVGSRVTKGQHLVAVTDPASVHVVIEVAALDLPVLKKAMDGELKIPGQDAPAKVAIGRLSPFVDPATGTASCEVDFKNKKDLPPPGSVGQVSFKVNARSAFVLPEHAVSYRGTESFVNLVQEGKAKRATVKLGRRQRGNIEILAGVKEGDVVVERTSGFLAEGDEVKVEKAESEKKESEKATTEEAGAKVGG